MTGGLKRLSLGVSLGVVAILAVRLSAADFPAGSGTATITWQPVASSPGTAQPYAGTVAGQPVSGQSVIPKSPLSGSTLTLATWTGTFEGKSFHVTFTTSLAGVGSGTATLKMKGSYGTWHISGTATDVGNSPVVSFSATVGPHHVTGKITHISQHGNTATAKAKFTVSS